MGCSVIKLPVNLSILWGFTTKQFAQNPAQLVQALVKTICFFQLYLNIIGVIDVVFYSFCLFSGVLLKCTKLCLQSGFSHLVPPAVLVYQVLYLLPVVSGNLVERVVLGYWWCHKGYLPG